MQTSARNRTTSTKKLGTYLAHGVSVATARAGSVPGGRLHAVSVPLHQLLHILPPVDVRGSLRLIRARLLLCEKLGRLKQCREHAVQNLSKGEKNIAAERGGKVRQTRGGSSGCTRAEGKAGPASPTANIHTRIAACCVVY